MGEEEANRMKRAFLETSEHNLANFMADSDFTVVANRQFRVDPNQYNLYG